MRMLSRLFDRVPARPATETTSPAEANTADPGRSTADNWADIGVKVGGENEALRNLLVDVARRIDALDDLRDIFGAHTSRRVDRDGTFHVQWAGDKKEHEA